MSWRQKFETGDVAPHVEFPLSVFSSQWRPKIYICSHCSALECLLEFPTASRDTLRHGGGVFFFFLIKKTWYPFSQFIFCFIYQMHQGCLNESFVIRIWFLHLFIYFFCFWFQSANLCRVYSSLEGEGVSCWHWILHNRAWKELWKSLRQMLIQLQYDLIGCSQSKLKQHGSQRQSRVQ